MMTFVRHRWQPGIGRYEVEVKNGSGDILPIYSDKTKYNHFIGLPSLINDIIEHVPSNYSDMFS